MNEIGKALFCNTPPLPEGLAISYEWNGNICDMSLTNTTDKDIKVGDVTVCSADMPFAPDTKFFGEGYTILSRYCGTVGGEFKLIGDYSDYGHYKMYKPEDVHQVYNMALFYPKGEMPLLVGFSSCDRFVGWIRFNKNVLQVALNCENITVSAGETIKLEQIYVNRGEKNYLLNDFAGAINENHPRREFPEIPTGWCSWLVYGPSISAQNVYDNLEAIKKHGLDLKYIQIDDGYQTYWGDWFDFTDKFEGGVKKVCLDIKAQGFEPSMWVAPFVAGGKSKLFSEHPDWFIKDDNGAPLCSGDVSFGGWGKDKPWYILDMTNPHAQDYIRTVFKTMHDEWAVRYFKLDAINWETMPVGHRYDDTKTCIEAYKIGMAIIREAVGEESFILGGNSPMWPSIGVVNGMRITNDNTRRWGKFVRLIEECFPRNWMHGRFWINDPDTVLLQNKMVEVEGPDGKKVLTEGPITKNEFAVNAAYTMASGGMVLSGDDVSTLREENVKILRKLLPPVEVAAEFENDDYSVARAKMNDDKMIIYVFNLTDEARSYRVAIDGRFEVLDLLEDESIGVCEGEICFEGFDAHYAKILVCNKVD